MTVLHDRLTCSQVFHDRFLPIAKELVTNPHIELGYAEFKEWDMDAVAEGIDNSGRLTEDSKAWWRRFFANHPRVSWSSIPRT